MRLGLKYLILFLLTVTGPVASAGHQLHDFSKAFEAGKIRRCQVFGIMPVNPRCIEFVGGSIMEDCEWKELLADDRIINRGIDGETVGELKARLAELLRHKPSSVFLEIGSGELGSVKAEEIVAEIEEIVEAFRMNDPEVRIYLMSSLPPADEGQMMLESVRDYNERLEGISDGEDVIYVDLYSAFADKYGLLPAECGRSNVKLSPKGYAVLGAVLKKYIQ